MVLKKIDNGIKKTFDGIKNSFSPINMMQNLMMSAMGMKPKSKFKIICEKIIGIVKLLNKKLLSLTDKIVSIYNKYIAGKPAKLWFFIKLLFLASKGLLKSIFGKIKLFYQKDKKRAVIYFILLYMFYRFVAFCCYKISSFMNKGVNKMVVLTRIVEPERAKKEVNCYGYLESENTLNYTSEVRGNTENIFVQEKQMVKEGQLLMIIDSKFTKNSYISAKSILENKKLQYNAIKKLYQDGLESKGNLKAMEADLENANSNFESAKKAYDGLMIKAPFDGFIDNIGNKEGAQVNPGQRLFSLERTDAMQVKCDVQNLKVEEVGVGDGVDVFISGKKMAEGEISVIGNNIDVDSGSRTILVRKIESISGDYSEYVRPGVSVMVKIPAISRKSVYKISAEALEVTETGGYSVKILNPNNGEVANKEVLIYDENNGMNYVSGLAPGDYVIERGHEFVENGEVGVKFEVINGTTEQNWNDKFRSAISGTKKFCFYVVDFFKNLPEFLPFIGEQIKDTFNSVVDVVANIFAKTNK